MCLTGLRIEKKIRRFLFNGNRYIIINAVQEGKIGIYMSVCIEYQLSQNMMEVFKGNVAMTFIYIWCIYISSVPKAFDI